MITGIVRKAPFLGKGGEAAASADGVVSFFPIRNPKSQIPKLKWAARKPPVCLLVESLTYSCELAVRLKSTMLSVGVIGTGVNL